MSLMQKVQALIAGIEDPKVRLDVASTIKFLSDLYGSGRANEEEVRSDLFDICADVIRMSNPALVEDEVRKRASIVADELFQTIRIELVMGRTMAKYRRATMV
jgi:hypothetical protein